MTAASDPVTERLAAILAAAALPPVLLAPLHRLLVLVDGDPAAPTTVTDPLTAADRHLADSLAALALPEVRAASVILDLGSGAGFPGLPLALARPEATVLLLDSVGKKVEFLTRAIAATGAVNASALHARAEDVTVVEAALAGRRPDLVAARAVGPLPVVLEYVAPLLAPGGAAVIWRGRRDPEAEAEGESVARLLGLEPRAIHAVYPFEQAEHRHLHVYTKVSETPPRFPRRPGVARKRPLSGTPPASEPMPTERI